MLVKLHRPPPDIRIFLPTVSLRSRTKTDRPRFPASMAHIKPAAPAPIITTSYTTRGSYTVAGVSAPVAAKECNHGRRPWCSNLTDDEPRSGGRLFRRYAAH